MKIEKYILFYEQNKMTLTSLWAILFDDIEEFPHLDRIGHILNAMPIWLRPKFIAEMQRVVDLQAKPDAIIFWPLPKVVVDLIAEWLKNPVYPKPIDISNLVIYSLGEEMDRRCEPQGL